MKLHHAATYSVFTVVALGAGREQSLLHQRSVTISHILAMLAFVNDCNDLPCRDMGYRYL